MAKRVSIRDRQFRRYYFSQIAIFVALFLMVLGFQNCSGKFQVKSGLTSQGFTVEQDLNLQQQSISILGTKCAACHDAATQGGVTGILNVDHLIASGLITPGNPSAGRLIGSIEDNSMPTTGLERVTPGELSILKSWISSIRVAGPQPTPSPTPPPPPTIPAGMKVGANGALQTQAMGVLQFQCAGCHQANSNAGSINKIMEPNSLVSLGLVTMGDSTKGRLIGSIVGKTMPKAGSYMATTPAELQVLRDWINSMSFVPLAAGEQPFKPLPDLAPTFTSIYANILLPKCVMCHGPARADKGIRYDTHALTVRTVSAGNANGSRLYTECRDRLMPEVPFQALNTAELSALQTWIASGAANN
jgi:cytochrome c553